MLVSTFRKRISKICTGQFYIPRTRRNTDNMYTSHSYKLTSLLSYSKQKQWIKVYTASRTTRRYITYAAFQGLLTYSYWVQGARTRFRVMGQYVVPLQTMCRYYEYFTQRTMHRVLLLAILGKRSPVILQNMRCSSCIQMFISIHESYQCLSFDVLS
jgi:hypothetical protein